MEFIIEQFIVCFNAVAPFFLIMAIGWFVRRVGLVGDPFFAGINKLTFTCFFPATLFMSMYTADLAAAFDLALVVYFVISTLLVYAVLWIVGARFLKDKLRCAVFVQAGYRSNYLVLAMPVIAILLGPEAVPRTALILPFLVTVNNIQAASLFVVAGQATDISRLERMKGIIIGVFKMPMIIGVIIGLFGNVLTNATGLGLPIVLYRGIDSVAPIAAPAALIGIGGALSMEKVRRNLRLAIAATAAKNVLVPLAIIVPAVLLGFRGVDLAIIAMIGLSPVGPSAYTTAVAMGGEDAGNATASCLVLSNAIAVFTIVPGLAILSILGLF